MRSPALLAVTLLAGLAAAPPAAATGRGPVDFEQRVTPPAAAAAPGRGATPPAAHAAATAVRATPPLTAPRRFDLLGLRWARGAAHVEVRVQRADGRWTRWVEAPPAEDAPAAGAASGPIWTGPARRYQLRGAHGTALPPGLRVRFVAVPRPARPPLARAAAGRPAIVPRSRWDPTNACPPRVAPRYGRIDLAFVHHTVTLGGYTRAEAPAVVLAICRFHRNGNGWHDIGYNLLVDRYGTVYEGRAGGVDQPVIGAQASGWNGVSTGVALVGTYAAAPPPAAAQRALERVLAWKLASAGVPALGTVTQTSYGGAENRWRAGARVRFPRIAGHRDGVRTTCPGAALYARLPVVRARAAARHTIPRDLLTASPIGGTLPPGGPASLTGRLALADGRRPVGAPLTLQQRAGGAWVDRGTVRTGPDGVWSAAVPVTVNGTFRVVAPDAAVASPPVRARVQAAVTARVSPQLLRAGRTVTVRGATSPAKQRVHIRVERQARPGGPWHAVGRTSATTDVDGAYALTVRLAAPGVHRIAVTTAADGANAAGAAPIRTARVLPARR